MESIKRAEESSPDYPCAICNSSALLYQIIANYPYYLCPTCNFLFMPYELSRVDYTSDYWENERAEAERREKEDCCMRALELIYLSKIPVRTLLDFGCGLGITVEWLRSTFGIDAIGIDKYGQFDERPFLLKEDILATDSLGPESIDAIMSVEVVEHLPQDMVLSVFRKLRDLLKPGGLMLINTGMLEFVNENRENEQYIDPSVRGHISIFSLNTFQKMAQDLNMVHIRMWMRSWCTLLLKPDSGVDARISPWDCEDENRVTLKKANAMFSLVRQTLWAEELNAALKRTGLEIPQGLKQRFARFLHKKIKGAKG